MTYKNKFKAIKKAQKKKKKVAEFYRREYTQHTDDEKLRNEIKKKELGK